MRLFTLFTLFLFCNVMYAEDFVYKRSVKLPKINSSDKTFHFSNGPIAYNPSTGGYVVRGNANYNNCQEVILSDVDGGMCILSGAWFNPTYGIDVSERARTNSWYRIRGMVITDEGNLRCCLSRWYNVSGSNEFPFLTGDLIQSKSYGPWNGGQHSLRLGGYITPLSPALRLHFGVRYGGGETSPEGTAASHDGPALYVFDFPQNTLTQFSTFTSTKVYGFDDPSPYPGWHHSHTIASIHSLPNKVIWMGREGYSDIVDVPPDTKGHMPSYWYGGGTKTFIKTDGSSITVTDEVYPNVTGQHSQKYRFRGIGLLNSKIIAGNVQPTDFFEFNLPECVGRTKTFPSAYNYHTSELVVLDVQSDGDQPTLRIYGVK